MSKFQRLREEAEVKFGQDPNEAAISSRALDFLEEWSQLCGCDGTNLSFLEKRSLKKECANYITTSLYRAREEEYGFLGALLGAIAFSLLVQIIVKWIMNRFFDK